MKIYTIHEAKTQLSCLIREVLAGEDVVIARRDEPLVTLNIFKPKKRKFGAFKGKGWIADDFDQPLVDFKD